VQRTLISRALAGVLSIWLAISLAEPVQLHTCALHGSAATQSADGSHHATHAGHSHDRSSDGKSKQCSCLGDCCAGRAIVWVDTSADLLASTTIKTTPAPFGYSSRTVVAPHFLLPFSNGPPTISSRA